MQLITQLTHPTSYDLIPFLVFGGPTLTGAKCRHNHWADHTYRSKLGKGYCSLLAVIGFEAKA